MQTNQILETNILQLIEQPLAGLGYLVVRVKLQKDETLQVMIERVDHAALVVADCSKATRAIMEIPKAQELIEDNYALEVSSPGLDRPLVSINDFSKFAGNQIKISLYKPTLKPTTTPKNFKAKLIGVEEGKIIVLVTGRDEPIAINHEDIDSAKLEL